MFLVFLLLFQHFFFSFSKWIFFHYAWPQCVQWSMSWGMDRGENALWIFRHSSFLSLSHHVKRKMCESILEEPRGPRGCRGRRKSKGIKAEETCCLFLLGWLPGNRHFMGCFWMKAGESGGCGEGLLLLHKHTHECWRAKALVFYRPRPLKKELWPWHRNGREGRKDRRAWSLGLGKYCLTWDKAERIWKRLKEASNHATLIGAGETMNP